MKKLPPLPEAWCVDYEECGINGDGWSEHQDVPLFTSDQMEEYETKAYAEGRSDERAEWRNLSSVVEQILEDGHMNTELLGALRSAWSQTTS